MKKSQQQQQQQQSAQVARKSMPQPQQQPRPQLPASKNRPAPTATTVPSKSKSKSKSAAPMPPMPPPPSPPKNLPEYDDADDADSDEDAPPAKRAPVVAPPAAPLLKKKKKKSPPAAEAPAPPPPPVVNKKRPVAGAAAAPAKNAKPSKPSKPSTALVLLDSAAYADLPAELRRDKAVANRAKAERQMEHDQVVAATYQRFVREHCTKEQQETAAAALRASQAGLRKEWDLDGSSSKYEDERPYGSHEIDFARGAAGKSRLSSTLLSDDEDEAVDAKKLGKNGKPKRKKRERDPEAPKNRSGYNLFATSIVHEDVAARNEDFEKMTEAERAATAKERGPSVTKTAFERAGPLWKELGDPDKNAWNLKAAKMKKEAQDKYDEVLRERNKKQKTDAAPAADGDAEVLDASDDDDDEEAEDKGDDAAEQQEENGGDAAEQQEEHGGEEENDEDDDGREEENDDDDDDDEAAAAAVND